MSMMVVIHIKDSGFSVDASEATTPGEFTSTGFNNPTIITDMVLSQTAGDAIKEQSLTPQSTFYLNATIQDFDGFTHQDIYFVVFHSDAAEITSAIVNEKINQGVTADSFVVRYFSPERSTYLSTAPIVLTGMTITTAVDNFMVKVGSTPLESEGISDHPDYISMVLFNAMTDHTWSLVSGDATITQTELVGAVQVAYERDLTIAFTPSKVAPQATGEWHVAVVVYDRFQMESPEPNANEMDVFSALDSGYNMAFYGEIQLEAGQSIQFDNVIRGEDTWTDSSTGVLVRYIANGEFTRTATADVRWDAAFLNSITAAPWAELHDPLSIDETKQIFYLQVLRDAASRYDIIEIQEDLAFATATEPIAIIPLMDTDYSIAFMQSMTSIVESNVARTSEVGQLTPFLFQIKLSSAFQNATYTGNMTIGITGG
jgi:hypothetical protein